jgi:HTH-type transcriptional regulator/antitoxin HipB
MAGIARTPIQLCNEIRENRRKLGLKQEQHAAKAGMRQRTVSDTENAGNARLDTVMRLLAALDLEVVLRVRTRSSAKEIEEIF